MDRKEARAVLREQLAHYKSRSFTELLALITEGEQFEIKSSSGNEYQVEIQAIWNDNTNRDLRIIGSIDDGRLRAYFPLTDDFFVRPDATLSENCSIS